MRNLCQPNVKNSHQQNDEVYDDDDEDENREVEYACLTGNVFDATLSCGSDQLKIYNPAAADCNGMFALRIAVDVAEQW